MQMQALRADDPLLEQKKALLVSLGADDDVDSGVEVEPRPGLLMCWRIRAHRRFATPHVVTLPVNSCCQNLRPGIDV